MAEWLDQKLHGRHLAQRWRHRRLRLCLRRQGQPYLITAEASWEQPDNDPANVSWACRALTELEPYASEGLYLNFPGLLEEGKDLVRASHGPPYPRLQALKHELDPDNIFRRNANIRPAIT